MKKYIASLFLLGVFVIMNISISSFGEIEMMFYFNHTLNIDDWIVKETRPIKKELFEVNNAQAYKVTSKSEMNGDLILMIFYKNNKNAVLISCWPYNTKHLNIFYKIVRSLKFN